MVNCAICSVVYIS